MDFGRKGTVLAFPQFIMPHLCDLPLFFHGQPRTTVTTRVRAAFTLIELLIVVVIIGILAAIAIPKFQNTKGKANAAALRSDLRNLAVAEEAIFYDSTKYSSDTAAMRFRPSPGVIITIMVGPTGGWAATATHPLSYPLKCVIFFGTFSPVPVGAPQEGVPGCQ